MVKIKKAILIGTGIGAGLSLLFNSFTVLAEWHALSPKGSDVLLWMSMYLILPLFAAVLLFFVGLIMSIFRQGRKFGFDLSSGCVFYVIIAVFCFRLAGKYRMAAFSKLADRSSVLVQAIYKYDEDQGKPPQTLQQLVPDYLPQIPSTSMGAYPEYEYLVADDANFYQGNPWVLVVHTPLGMLNYDMFMYFPKQHYPEQIYGGNVEKIKDWAYVHE